MGVRGRGGVVFSALALCSALLSSQTAHADIPPECGSREAFEAELKKRLGDDAPVESVTVHIAPRTESAHLRVEIGEQVRELDDANCQELLRAAVVVAVSMLLQAHEAPIAEKETESPPVERSRTSHFLIGLGGGVNVGTLPRATPAVEFEAQALWRYWGLALGARYLTPNQKLDARNRGANLQALALHLAGVLRPARPWQIRLGFGVQRLEGDGEGAASVRSASAWAAGPTLGAGYIPYEVGPLWLGLAAEGQLNAVRGNFQILNYNQGDDRVVHEVPWLSSSAFVRFGTGW